MPAPSPCILVIFGASGDLAKVKLLPAIYALAREKLLPEKFALVGYSRTEMTHDQFRDRFREAVAGAHEVDNGLLEDLLARTTYHAGQYDQADDFDGLKRHLDAIDAEHGTDGNRLFYLSTPPSTFAPVVHCLGERGLVQRGYGRKPWARVVIEKPFGYDLESARKLNGELYERLTEEQIFRIDHYLGKELVQNILVLRFANVMFEPVWNHHYVDHVQITVAESVSADDRGGYYDRSGALRDMVQNHMLQLLALTAMEAPAGLDARSTRDEKVKVFKSIRAIKPEQVTQYAVRGQYGPGDLANGRRTGGYRNAEGVDQQSTTETFAAAKLYIDNWRWNGTPFYLRTGKGLPKKVSEIAVRFRRPPIALFQKQCDSPVYPNDLIIHVAPNPGISLRVNGKVPGSALNIKTVAFEYNYAETFKKEPPEAYERLIADAMQGDQSLFIRGDEAEAAWCVVDPILKGWRMLDGKGQGPESYEPNSWGPRAGFTLIERDHRHWLESEEMPEPVLACSI